MKLTADLILQSAQFTNALKDRELDLRGINMYTLCFYVLCYSLAVNLKFLHLRLKYSGGYLGLTIQKWVINLVTNYKHCKMLGISYNVGQGITILQWCARNINWLPKSGSGYRSEMGSLLLKVIHLTRTARLGTFYTHFVISFQWLLSWLRGNCISLWSNVLGS